MDCMEGMGQFPDKYFDLAIVDPPYGVGITNQSKFGSSEKIDKYGKQWDKRPDSTYFTELKRVSKHQIIWGGNYFISDLKDTRCMLIWDKMNGTNDYADGEIAWCSIDSNVEFFRMHHFNKNYDRKIHPTQKPIQLYRWTLKKHGQAGWKILDTHVGSGSSLIACEREGFQYVGFEIDPDYYKAAMERIERERNILTLALQ